MILAIWFYTHSLSVLVGMRSQRHSAVSILPCLILCVTLGVQGIFGAHLFSTGMQCLGSFLIAFSFYLSGWVRALQSVSPLSASHATRALGSRDTCTLLEC